MQGFKGKNQQFAEYSYFLALTMVPSKINSLLVDFVILFLIFIFYQTCQFWCVNGNYEVFISSETQQMLNVYMKKTKFDPSQADNNNLLKLNPGFAPDSKAGGGPSNDVSASSLDNMSATPTSNHGLPKNGDNEKSKMTRLIKSLQGSSFWYRLYKHLQRSANIHNPKFMIAAVLFLAIASNTIFSLAFITILSYAMLRYKLFLEVNMARFVLRPIIRNIMMPLALLEILLHIVYQIPIAQLQMKDLGVAAQHIINMFGLTKYWVMFFDTDDDTIQFLDGFRNEEVVRLCCKALIYFFLSIQVQIFQSKSFERIKDVKSVGRMKGEAMTYRFNNKKIKKYLKYQSINLKKEQMMIKVKANCDRWRALFEKQAEQQYLHE